MFLNNFFITFYNFIKKNYNFLSYLFGIISILLGFLTYYLIEYKGGAKIRTLNFSISLALLDLTSILIFVILITIKILELRKKQVQKSLQSEIIMVFSIITIIPTIIISIFSVYFFIFGIQSWFNNKVTSMLDLSVKVGNAYVEEHNLYLKNTAISLAKDLSVRHVELKNNSKLFQRVLSAYADIRELDEAIVFQGANKNILAKSRFSYSLTFSQYPQDQIDDAQTGKVVKLPTKKDRIRFLIKLEDFDDTYLVVGRIVDENILEYIDESNGVAVEFNKLHSHMNSLQIKFIFVFILISIVLLLSAIIIGILFANKILNPINILVNAIKSVKQGDLSTRIKIISENNEIALLSRGFNEMVTSIDKYRKDLVLVEKSLAWGDVAKRVAHEIKNPLTPMQLAADRLKTKYEHQIYHDKEKFNSYLDTIIRHIDDISKIVYDFVNFVRMPKPIFQTCNFLELLKELVEAREALHEDIKYSLYSNLPSIEFSCDKNQINQLFVNLFQNSEEALENIENKEIFVSVIKGSKNLIITVTDNGIGFPDSILNKSIEPYVTTKTNGTGLGLSIIERIINDHDGILEIDNKKEGGAYISIKFQFEVK
jgi:two-component system nitrogen regulation sensor histidine kinase NtrY